MVIGNAESSGARDPVHLNDVLCIVVVQLPADRVYNDAVVLDLEPLMEELQGPALGPQGGVRVPTFEFGFE